MATTEGLRAERLARVNDAIQGSGYNQTEIARAMDVSKAAVSRWMTGASCPTRDKIVALEKLLGLPARSLVNGTTGAPSKSEEELRLSRSSRRAAKGCCSQSGCRNPLLSRSG